MPSFEDRSAVLDFFLLAFSSPDQGLFSPGIFFLTSLTSSSKFIELSLAKSSSFFFNLICSSDKLIVDGRFSFTFHYSALFASNASLTTFLSFSLLTVFSQPHPPNCQAVLSSQTPFHSNR